MISVRRSCPAIAVHDTLVRHVAQTQTVDAGALRRFGPCLEQNLDRVAVVDVLEHDKIVGELCADILVEAAGTAQVTNGLKPPQQRSSLLDDCSQFRSDVLHPPTKEALDLRRCARREKLPTHFQRRQDGGVRRFRREHAAKANVLLK